MEWCPEGYSLKQAIPDWPSPGQSRSGSAGPNLFLMSGVKIGPAEADLRVASQRPKCGRFHFGLSWADSLNFRVEADLVRPQMALSWADPDWLIPLRVAIQLTKISH